MADNRRQHTVPQFYLRYFADGNDQLAVYDTETPRFFMSPSGNLAVERDAYTPILRGTKANVADRLNKAVEVFCAPKLAGLAARPQTVASEQWQAMWVLSANLILRSRHYRDGYTEPARYVVEFSKRNASFLKHLRLPGPVASMFGMHGDVFAESTEVIAEVAERHYSSVQSLLVEAGKFLASRQCDLLVAENGHEFITSDDPVIVHSESGKPEDLTTNLVSLLESTDATVYVPITPHCACWWHTGASLAIGTARREEITRINELTARRAYRQIYSRHESFLRELVAKVWGGAPA